MPKYAFKCGACSSVLELYAEIMNTVPTATCTSCMIPMQRDYSANNTGFIPTDGMYAKESRKK